MLHPIRLFKVLLILALLPFQQAFGADASYGNTKLSNSTSDDLLHHGRLDLNGMTMKGTTRVNGTLNVDKSTLQNVTVNGRGNIENSTVLGNIQANGMLNLEKVKIAGFVEVSGYVQTDNSTIDGELIVSSDKIEIKDSNLFRIRMRPTLSKSDSPDYRQVVVLKNTTVLGNVIFQDGHGELIQEKSIIKGDIIGLAEQKKS